MKRIDNIEIKVWVGLLESDTGVLHSIDEAYDVLQAYVDENPFCVSVTPTRFIYHKGNEPGVIVGLISYVRFPRSCDELERLSIEIGDLLMRHFRQKRVSITVSRGQLMQSIMLENDSFSASE